MKRYWYHFPGMVYAGNVYASNMHEARARLRAELGIKRLPNGTAIWSDQMNGRTTFTTNVRRFVFGIGV